jgi:hypothetical protein
METELSELNGELATAINPAGILKEKNEVYHQAFLLY